MLAKVRNAFRLALALAAVTIVAAPAHAQSSDERPSTPAGLVATVYPSVALIFGREVASVLP